MISFGVNLQLLEDWLKSYKPEELFDKNGTLNKELQELDELMYKDIDDDDPMDVLTSNLKKE